MAARAPKPSALSLSSQRPCLEPISRTQIPLRGIVNPQTLSHDRNCSIGGVICGLSNNVPLIPGPSLNLMRRGIEIPHFRQAPGPDRPLEAIYEPVTSAATMLSLVSSGQSAPLWAQKLDPLFFNTVSPLYHSTPVFVAAFLVTALAALVLYYSNTSIQSYTNSLATMAVSPASKAKDPSGDFEGDIKVNNNPPTKPDLEKVADLPVLDVNKKSHTFKSLWADDENGPRRVLVVFIRHFFCGVCSLALVPCSGRYMEHALTALIYAELPRIPPHPLFLPNPRIPLATFSTYLRCCHRLRFPRSDTYVHKRDSLSIPHLCRPNAPTISQTRHDSDVEPRLEEPGIYAAQYVERRTAEYRPRIQEWKKYAVRWRLQTSGWGVRFPKWKGCMVPSNEKHTRPCRNPRGQGTDRTGRCITTEARSVVYCWVGPGAGEEAE